jgi:N-acetyl sugar amidotransferase
MSFITYPSSVNLKPYMKNNGPFEAKYGLPEKVLYCKKCVSSNQRPNSTIEYKHKKNDIKKTMKFDESGICDACRMTEKKNTEIDWKEREKLLIDLCNKHRSKDGSYDCLLPGSGGKDSFYASHILKEKYGMHPLTVTWAPHVYTEWGWQNFQSWIHAGFDNYLLTPNARVHRLLTRLAVENLFHPFQGFIVGQKSFAPKMAAMFNIPLVFYGENEAEYGNPILDNHSPKREQSFSSEANKFDIHLGGVSITELEEEFGLEKQDLIPYLPLNTEEILKKNIEVQYLGYYLKWHPQSCYYYAVEHGGFIASPERTPGTYSKYNSIDDRVDDLHFYTTGIKFGIGRATSDASQEIRSGDILREEGVALVNRFDHEFPERFSDQLFKYLSIPEKEFPIASKMFEQPIVDRKYFDLLTDNFRSPHLWKYENGNWKLRHKIT